MYLCAQNGSSYSFSFCASRIIILPTIGASLNSSILERILDKGTHLADIATVHKRKVLMTKCERQENADLFENANFWGVLASAQFTRLNLYGSLDSQCILDSFQLSSRCLVYTSLPSPALIPISNKPLTMVIAVLL